MGQFSISKDISYNICYWLTIYCKGRQRKKVEEIEKPTETLMLNTKLLKKMSLEHLIRSAEDKEL